MLWTAKITFIATQKTSNPRGFTATSSQHINKFISDYSGARWCTEASVYMFREVEG